MTKKRLEMLKEVEELRRVEAVKQYKECEQEIKKHIEDIIGMDNVKVTRVSDNYENWSLEVSVVDEKEERICRFSTVQKIIHSGIRQDG